MKRLSNLFILLLLVSGILVLSYPVVSNLLASKNHSKAIQEYKVSVADLAASEVQEHFDRAKAYNDSLTGSQIVDPFAPTDSFVLPEEYTSILNVNGMIGYIEIPSIGVYLPIYHTTAEEVLQKGVGHMQATAFPIGGEYNHPVMTAHRGLPAAKLFTNLNKFQIGDKFYIHVLDRTFAYQGEQIVVVEPHETDELRPVKDKDYVTLITCTPYAINSHRLFVRGERIPYTPDEEIEEPIGRKRSRLIYGIPAAIILTGCSGVFLYRKRFFLKR